MILQESSSHIQPSESGWVRAGTVRRFRCGRDAYAKCRWSECQTVLRQSRQAVTPASSRGTSGCPSRDCLSEASHLAWRRPHRRGPCPRESNLPNAESGSSCPRCRSAFPHSRQPSSATRRGRVPGRSQAHRAGPRLSHSIAPSQCWPGRTLRRRQQSCSLFSRSDLQQSHAGFRGTDFSLCAFPPAQKSKPRRLNRLRKKAENCHSERRVCAKNPSWSFVFNREGFFASLRMTTKALFPQPVKPVLLKTVIRCNTIPRGNLTS